MADTIEIIQGTATVVEVAGPTGPQGPSGSVGATGATGPAGPAGTGIETLTTKGDLLSRDDSAAIRVGIGSTGQVLKVSAQGLPTWANESGAVSSVAGKTGVVTLDKNDVGLGNVSNTAQVTSVTGTAPIVSSGGTTPAISISAATTSAAGSMSAADKTKLDGIAAGAEVNVQSNWTEADTGSDAFIQNKPSTFAPSSHSASHASAGSDPLAPSDIGAQSIFVTDSLVLSTGAEVTLTAARAKILDVLNFSGSDVDVVLPQTGNQVGDTFVFRWASGSNQILVRGVSAGSPVISLTSGEQKRVIRGTSNWSVIPVDTHTHAASAITSGTLAHERGGLEADVSAYNGLVKISGGATSAVTVTSAGEALLDDADAAAQRTTLGLGTAATAATGDFATASHTHELTALAATGATNGHVLTANGSNGVTFAALPASGVTGAASSASDVLGVSGANITGVDANADRIVYWNNTSNKLAYGTPADAGAAAASHTHTSADINSQTASNGHVLTANGSGGASFAALPASGISAVGASTADVLSVSGSDLIADDGGTIDSADPFIKWDDTNSKLVYANPLSRPSGAFYVGLAPTSTALGTNSVNIQSGRDSATHLAKDASSVCVGYGARSTSSVATAIGHNSTSGNGSFAGGSTASAGNDAVAVGFGASGGNSGTAIGRSADVGGNAGVAIGYLTSVTAVNAVAVGYNVTGGAGALRAGFNTRPFSAVYWGGQTTDGTANVELNLDATATNRMVIAANTAVIADIFVIARRTDNTKFLSARRWVAIRRDGSNNTALIGAVQTIGTDQSEGSPTWTFTIDADDTASVESLRVRVTGAAAETVNWRVCAIYRVVT